VDLIPLEWLHLTMQGVGFVGEVPDDDLAAIRAAVGRRLASIPPASLSFGPTVLLPEAIALPPLPAEPVHVIRGAIRAGIADVWGGSGVPEADDGYRAHVSIGYVNSPGSARPIVDALRRTNAEPASVTVWAASLIMLNRDERVYRWSTVDAVPLGGETVSPLSPESPYPG
jgi:2'-5' RNA ligase